MPGSRRESYGWMMLGLVALVPLAFGIKGLISAAPGNLAVVPRLTGLNWDQLRSAQPGVGRLVSLLSRHEAIALLAWGIWLAVSGVRGYRTGDRWVWQVWWTTPMLILAVVLSGVGAPGPMRPLFLLLLLLSLVGLILARPRSAQHGG